MSRDQAHNSKVCHDGVDAGLDPEFTSACDAFTAVTPRREHLRLEVVHLGGQRDGLAMPSRTRASGPEQNSARHAVRQWKTRDAASSTRIELRAGDKAAQPYADVIAKVRNKMQQEKKQPH